MPIRYFEIGSDIFWIMSPNKTHKHEGKVGIVLLNWNGLEDTLECLSSLRHLEYKNHVCIVVDNDSSQDPSLIAESFPDIVLIRSAENLGFAAGNNLGFQKADELDCDYVWVLNNDTLVEPDSLTLLVHTLDEHADIAAVTNLITYNSDKSMSWFAGGVIRNGIPANLGHFKPITGDVVPVQHDVEDTGFLSGCSFLARLDLLKAIKGFDEAYFCYVEDVDISVTLQRLGYRIAYHPAAVVHHKVSKSTGRRSPVKFYYKHRNMQYYLRKHHYPAISHVHWWWASVRTLLSLVIKERELKVGWCLGMGLLDGALNRMGKCERF